MQQLTVVSLSRTLLKALIQRNLAGLTGPSPPPSLGPNPYPSSWGEHCPSLFGRPNQVE